MMMFIIALSLFAFSLISLNQIISEKIPSIINFKFLQKNYFAYAHLLLIVLLFWFVIYSFFKIWF